VTIAFEGETTFVPRRAIGPFTNYCVIEETCSHEAVLTEHPVQDGAAITDHIYLKPSQVTVRGLYGPTYAPLNETFDKLRQLLAARGIFDVVTGKAKYSNMAMRRLVINNDEFTENAVAFTIELQEIIIVSVEVVSVPPAENQQNPSKTRSQEDAGKKQASEVKDPAAADNRTSLRKGSDAVLSDSTKQSLQNLGILK